LRSPRLLELVRLDDGNFRTLFAKTAIKRTGRDRFIRNVLIAVGNSGDERFVADVKALLDDASPLVRGAAVWALSKLLPRANLAVLSQQHRDPDPTVQEEWTAALG
jgi:epoxyqueuosine reductase